jgi:hypothetical protein
MLRRSASGLFIPAAAWALSKIITCAAALSLSLNPLDPMTWARFDSFHYMSNAAQGYHLVYMPRTMNGHTSLWGGNTIGWPLYAWIAGFLSRILPWSLPWIALSLSASFHFALLWLLWELWLKKEAPDQAKVLMALAAVFPGMIYFQAIFPFSLFVCLAMIFLHQLERENWLACAAVGLLAGMAHTSALFLPAAVGIWAAAQRPFSWRRCLPPAAAATAVLAGFGLVFVVMRVQTGVWDAAPKTWEFYRYTSGWSLLRLRQMIYMPPLSRPSQSAEAAVIAQGTLVAALCALAAFGWSKRAGRTGPSLLLVFAWVYWLAPHCSPLRQSFYRNEACVFPILPLIAFLPRRYLAVLTGAAAVISFAISRQFFQSVLI